MNTIVIAILVVIVLLVIVVFFTTNVGRTGDQIGEVAGCNEGNAALTTLGWSNIYSSNEVRQDDIDSKVACGNDEIISLIPKVKGKEDDTFKVCCGTPKE